MSDMRPANRPENQISSRGRRQFLRRATMAAALPVLPFGLLETRFCATNQADTSEPAPPAPLPECEWCGTDEAPANLSWRTRIAPKDEPGEPIVISGTVYRTDGTTPASGIVVYAYHTDITGLYTKRGDETGNGLRHGRLRGWMRTDAAGRYEFHTIKPAGYPGRKDPAHIHMTLAGKGYPERWIDSIWFEGDPRITTEMRGHLTGRGGFEPILKLTRGRDEVLRGVRDIRLDPQ